MARTGSKRGGSSAARSAAAKKGWETRRQGGASAASKRTAASKPKKRGIEKRLDRSAMVLNRWESNRIGRMGGITPGHSAKRRQQHKQALANFYGKQSASGQKKAMAKIKAYRLMN